VQIQVALLQDPQFFLEETVELLSAVLPLALFF
jgi:hypothetical protein